MNKRYAIVGFGCAGYHAAEAIRAHDPAAPIDAYERTGEAGSNPWLTTYYAGSQIDYSRMFPFGDRRDISARLNVNFVSDEVRRLDTNCRRLDTSRGASAPYDAILLATGASPVMPAALARGGKPVFVMRTADDAEKLRQHLQEHEAHTAAVVGASMVGIKVAELLHRRGIKTSLMDAAVTIFPFAAYPSTASVIEAALIEQGLELRMGVTIAAVNREGVVLDDGSTVPAEIVCLCIGTRANLDILAETQEPTIAVRRGIVVDTRMETSVPGIYAAGDCCEGTDLQTGATTVIGLWASAAAQGACAGRNMAGAATDYYGSFPHNVTRFFGMTFVGLGDPALPGEHLASRGAGFAVEAVRDGRRLCSMNILGDCAVSGVFKSLMQKQFFEAPTRLSATQAALLANSGVTPSFMEFIGGSVR